MDVQHVISVDAVTVAPKKSGIPCNNSRCSKQCLTRTAGVAVVLAAVLALAIALPLTLVSRDDDSGGTSPGSANGEGSASGEEYYDDYYDPDDCRSRTDSICDISFGPNLLQTLDLYKTDAAAAGMPPAPCVVYVHGGGWSGGDKSTNTNPPWWILDLRQRGYHVASTNYRLASEPGNDKHPAQIEDVESAVVYLKRHALEYNLDPEKIVVIGNSAGGHLVSLLGTRNGPESEARVAAVVNFYGGATLYGEESDQAAIVNLLGCRTPNVPGTACHETALEASPDQYVAADNPPFLTFHGRDDTVVHVNGSKIFHSQLTSAGANSTLVIVPGVGHDKDRVACSLTDGLVNTELIYRWIDAKLSPGAPCCYTCGIGCGGDTIYGDGTQDTACLRSAAAAKLD